MKKVREFAFMVTEEILANPGLKLSEVIRELEDEVILNMLISNGDNQSAAAKRLGMSRTALIYKLKIIRSHEMAAKGLDDNGQRLDGN